MPKVNILFLMGKSSESKESIYPLYLSENNGKTILELQVEKCFSLRPTQISFCAKKSDLNKFNLRYTFSQLYDCTKTYEINNATKGAVCSALLAIDSINNDNELIILAIDDLIDIELDLVINTFREKQADAGFIYFKSIHPKYAFADIDQENIALGFSEKKAITKNALASIYYFKHGADFVDAAKTVIKKDSPINDNFYISQTLNELVLLNKKIYGYQILPTQYHSLKTEKELNSYLAGVNYEEV